MRLIVFISVAFLADHVASVTNFNQLGVDCSEICLTEALASSTTPAETLRLHTVVQMINGLKEIRIRNGINATAIALDTNVAQDHAFEYDHGGIFSFQQNLAAVIAFTTPAWIGNPFFVNQFDGEQAWYCDNWNCRTRCDAVEYILYELEDVLQSSNPGAIEDSCHLARRALKHDYCALTNAWKNPLLISIVNSPFNDRLSRRSDYSKSFCKKFKHRYIIGTHASDHKQIRKFASRSKNSLGIEDSPEFKKTLSNLVECMQLECCATALPPASRGAQCVRSDGMHRMHEFKVKN